MPTIQHDNEEILARLSAYLNVCPDAITPEALAELASSCALSDAEAYAALLSAHCDLPPRLYRQYLPHMLRRLDPAAYLADAYLQCIRPVQAVCGGIELTHERYAPMELFVCDDLRIDREGRVLPQLGWFSEAFPYPAIKENGRIWMTVTPNEINTIQPAVAQSFGKVLAFGLGLGYYAFHASQRNDVSSVTVVEMNPSVIRLFEEHILPQFPHKEKLRIVQADAFDYARHTMPHEGFDVVFTDLWHDVGDGLPLYRRMKALEVPGPRYLYWIEPTLLAYLTD